MQPRAGVDAARAAFMERLARGEAAVTMRGCHAYFADAAATNDRGAAPLGGLLSGQRCEKSALEALREARPPKEL